MKFVERHKRASEIVGGEWDLHEENTCEDTGFAVRDLPPIELLVNCIGVRFDHKSKMRDHPYAKRLSEEQRACSNKLLACLYRCIFSRTARSVDRYNESEIRRLRWGDAVVLDGCTHDGLVVGLVRGLRTHGHACQSLNSLCHESCWKPRCG